MPNAPALRPALGAAVDNKKVWPLGATPFVLVPLAVPAGNQSSGNRGERRATTVAGRWLPAPISASVNHAVEAVTGVAQAGDDVGVFVEVVIHSGNHDGDVGAVAHGFLNGLEALGGGQ